MEHKDVHRAQKWMGWGAGNSNSEIFIQSVDVHQD